MVKEMRRRSEVRFVVLVLFYSEIAVVRRRQVSPFKYF